MFLLIIVINYSMVCLITASIDYKQKIIIQRCAFFIDFLNFIITDVLMDYYWLPVLPH